jgi:hypothetical protein
MSLTDDILSVIRAENDPTRAALAVLRAVEQHVQDLEDDDPGDDDERVRPLVARLKAHLYRARQEFNDLTRRRA